MRSSVEAPDTVRREIVDGWLYIDGRRVEEPNTHVTAESSVPFHGDAVRELIAAFLPYRLDHEGQVHTAPMDVWFGDDVLPAFAVTVDTVLGPDLFDDT